MENDQIHIHPNRNENWNTIIDWCPTGAIAMDSREMSVEMVMEEIRKDKSFYRYGNGGVTISGGEPLLQWKFTKELLKACKRRNPHRDRDILVCRSGSDQRAPSIFRPDFCRL